jgi:acyl-CoA synthetase (AMP-forming)/AMP-acid ligase II/acyl carrier protein
MPNKIDETDSPRAGGEAGSIMRVGGRDMGAKSISNEDIELATERLRRLASADPDRSAASFIDDDLEVRQSWTFGELDRRARSMAAFLQSRGAIGRRVVLAYPTCLDFLAAFYGCLYAGVVAVPASLPLAHGKDRRLELIVADSGATLVLTTAKCAELIARRLAEGEVVVEVLPTDALDDHSGAWRESVPAAGDLAFLQYTSGSTRSPSGVMVSHGNLAANLEMLREGVGNSPESIGVSWLPLFHDMGLVAGALSPTYAGAPLYLMAPASFVQNPMRWPRAVTRYRGTIGGGPNFAYQACVDAARTQGIEGLDLTCWDIAWNGAEPVRASTVTDFIAAFGPAGFRAESLTPAFGLAEATLLVTGKRGRVGPDCRSVDETALRGDRVILSSDSQAKRLVGSGEPAKGVDVRIVDPETRAVAGAATVGEIWVRSGSVGQGYWGKPEESEAIFRASTADGDGPFLRTGDLGFLQDGELFVAGRRKDLIVIRGVNYYPQDIEQTVEAAHPALRPASCAVFGVEEGDTLRVVAVAELRRSEWRKADPAEVFVSIRREVAREHQVALNGIVLLKAYGLPKTSSGKVQRAACRAALRDGTLAVVHEWRSTLQVAPIDFSGEPLSQPGVLERQLIDWLRRECGVDDITWKTPLMDLGIDSLKGVELGNALSAAFEHSFPVTLMIEHPTVEALARLIREEVLRVEPDEPIAPPPIAWEGAALEQQIDLLDDAELDALLAGSIDAVLKTDRRS